MTRHVRLHEARGTQKRKSQWDEEVDRNANRRNDTMRTEYKKRKVRNLMDNDVLYRAKQGTSPLKPDAAE